MSAPAETTAATPRASRELPTELTTRLRCRSARLAFGSVLLVEILALISREVRS